MVFLAIHTSHEFLNFSGCSTQRKRAFCGYPGCDFRGLQKNIHKHTRRVHKGLPVKLGAENPITNYFSYKRHCGSKTMCWCITRVGLRWYLRPTVVLQPYHGCSHVLFADYFRTPNIVPLLQLNCMTCGVEVEYLSYVTEDWSSLCFYYAIFFFCIHQI